MKRANDAERFLRAVKNEMEKQGMTVTDLARKSLISEGALHRAFKQWRNMHENNKEAIRRALGKPELAR